MKITHKHIPASTEYSLNLTNEEASKLYKVLEEGQVVLDREHKNFAIDLLDLLGERDL